MSRLTFQRTAERTTRRIGPVGSVARAAVGSALLADVVTGHASGGWQPASWVLAIVVLPAVLLFWQWARIRRNASPLAATGPLAHALNIGVFFALYFAGELFPALDPTSDAAVIFYGASMLLAAARGYAGCEVLAVSNWVLKRDDQIGCAVFYPIDVIERARRAGSGASHAPLYDATAPITCTADSTELAERGG